MNSAALRPVTIARSPFVPMSATSASAPQPRDDELGYHVADVIDARVVETVEAVKRERRSASEIRQRTGIDELPGLVHRDRLPQPARVVGNPSVDNERHAVRELVCDAPDAVFVGPHRSESRRQDVDGSGAGHEARGKRRQFADAGAHRSLHGIPRRVQENLHARCRAHAERRGYAGVVALERRGGQRDAGTVDGGVMDGEMVGDELGERCGCGWRRCWRVGRAATACSTEQQERVTAVLREQRHRQSA